MSVQVPVAPQKQAQANSNDSETRKKSEPGIKLLRKDIFGRIECHKTQQENSQSMCNGHDAPQENRVFGGPPSPHQIGADDCFAVSWGEGMKGTQSEGDKHGKHDDIDTQN